MIPINDMAEQFGLHHAENQIAIPKNYANRAFANKEATGWAG